MRKHFLQAWSGEPQLQQDIKTTVVSKEIKCQMIYFLTIMVNTSIDRVEKVWGTWQVLIQNIIILLN
jgi:hypothetical protein